MLRAVAALASAMAVGCVDVAEEHRCTVDADCTLDGVTGHCEADRACSFDDASCGTGNRRYHERAGAKANRCIIAAPLPGETPVLELAADTTKASCAAVGAYDAMIDIVTDIQQTIYFDTGGVATSVGAALALRAGACPGTAEVQCTSQPCGAINFGRIVYLFEPGSYCLVVENAVAATAGNVAIRAIPAGRPAPTLVLGAASTCDGSQGDSVQPMMCGLSSSGADVAYLFATCPHEPPRPTRFVAGIDPVDTTFDTTLSVRGVVPTGAELACGNNGGPGVIDSVDLSLAEVGPYWLVVDRIAGPACGGFDTMFAFDP